MDNDKKIKYLQKYIPFLILAIWIIAMHFCIIMGTGDDAWFSKTAHADGFELFSWLKERYANWSSRTLIEATLVIAVSLPNIIWRITDSLIMVLCMVMIAKMFIKDNKYGYAFLGLLLLIVDYWALVTAGWQATTINYLWPMTFMLVAVYPVFKWYRNENIRGYEYIIYTVANVYAAFSEQACVILLIIYLVAGIYAIHKRYFKINKFYVFQIVLNILGVLNAMLCPGNAARNISETATWFPEYKTFSVIQKVDIGISSTIKSLFLEKNIMFLLFLFVLAVLGVIKYKNLIVRFFMILPFIVTGGLNILRVVIGNQNGLFSFVTSYGVLYEKTNHFLKIYLWYAFLLAMCVVILADIAFVVSDRGKAMLVDLIFLIGLMSKAMLGFSATVWASYGRTGWYCQIAMVCCIIVLLEDWKYKQKTATYFMVAIFVILAVMQMLYNYTRVFTFSF